MKTYFVTGGNRGIGLGLSREILKAGNQLIVTCRNPKGERDLWELEGDYHEKIKILEMDVSDDMSIQKVFASLGIDQVIDTLINNAGVFEQFGEKLADIDFEKMSRTLLINSMGPMKVLQQALPFLKKSSEPKVFQITSEMGSIANNTSGGSYAYRASKAALNMMTKCVAVENPNMTAVVLHPGWVQTSMGGSNAPVTVDE